MVKNTVLLVALIAITGILTGAAFFKDKYMSKDGVKIVIYKQGKEIPIDPGNPHFKELQTKCEDFLTSANNTYKCVITPEMVISIKNNESAIETIYRKQKELTITSYNHQVKGDHLLIPLTGEEATKGENPYVVMYFYGRKIHSSPWAANRDITEITTLLKSVGIEID